MLISIAHGKAVLKVQEGLTVSHAAPGVRGHFLKLNRLRCMLKGHSYGGSLPRFGIHMTGLEL